MTAAMPNWNHKASLALLVHVTIVVAACDAAIRDSFETVEPSFRLIERDCELTVLDHSRSAHRPRTGQTCESISLRCGSGTKVYFAQGVEAAHVIDELRLSIWVRSNRRGIQLMARVVFPRTRDPRTNRPMTAMIRGTVYNRVGSWQQLILDHTPKLMTEQAWLLRRRHTGHRVDTADAFIDQVILNVYGGRGEADVGIDDLEIDGHVRADPVAVPADGQPFANGPLDAPATFVSRGRANLQGTVLEADGRPLMVKMIDHNGESFDWLKSLGFNTIRLPAPPNPEQLVELRRLGMWIVAPPPDLLRRGITKAHDRVLAWDLGQRLSINEVHAVRRLADDVRRVDPNERRPLLCNPTAGVWAYSRFSDILLLGRDPIGSSFPLSEMAAWLRNRMLLSRGGRPFWAEVQTEPGAALLGQLAVLNPAAATVSLEPDQIRLLALEAIAAGARGLALRSRSRLDADHPAASLRAATLRLLNLELDLIEPWVSGGTYVGEIKTNRPAVRVSVLRTDRSRLLIVRRHAPHEQFVTAGVAGSVISFVDAGATSSATAFQIRPGAGATEIRFQREPEGVRITLDSPQRVSFVVVSSDPLVRRFAARRSHRDHRETAELQHRLATAWSAETERIQSSLPQAATDFAARDDGPAILRNAYRLLNSGDSRSAFEFAARAMHTTSRSRRNDWQQAIDGFPAPSSSPFCTNYSTLPAHWELIRQVPSVRWSANVLPGGDCENLPLMRSRGWRNSQTSEPEIETSVSLSPQAAYSGQFGLQLRVRVADRAEIPAALETVPSRISTPAIPLRAGQLVRVHGWVKLPAPIRGSLDGLIVSDSIGGLQLAQRVRQPQDWRPFTFYRIATHDGPFAASFALTGIGEAWLDDLSVRVAGLPSHSAPANPSGTN